MPNFYELDDDEVAIILDSLKFQRDLTWGEMLSCSRIELDYLIAYMETRERS